MGLILNRYKIDEQNKLSQKYNKKNYYIGIAGIIIGSASLVVMGYFAFRTYAISDDMLLLQKKTDSLGQAVIGFDELLSYSRQTDSSTNELLAKLNLLLDNSNKNQEEINNNNKLAERSNESKFYNAIDEIHLILGNTNTHSNTLRNWDSLEIYSYLNEMDGILKGQLDNPFLLSNKYMLNDWRNVMDSISRFIFDDNFMYHRRPQEVNYNDWDYNTNTKLVFHKWTNCFRSIVELSEATDSFMLYYKWGRNDKYHKFRRPTPEYYREILKIRALSHAPM